MSSTKQTGRAPSSNIEAYLPFFLVVPVVLASAITWPATHLAANIDDRPAPPKNPIALLIGLVDGSVAWTTTTTVLAAIGGTLLLALTVVVARLIYRTIHGQARVDKASRRMGKGTAVRSLSAKGAGVTATRLGIDQSPGIVIGRALGGGVLYQDWEAVSVDVWGPRTGKTSSRAIPAVLGAPGAVLATSNKADLADSTRDLRASAGTVWVFDPQKLVNEPNTWWWDPLSYVSDETKADALAAVFYGATRNAGEKSDPAWDVPGTGVVSAFLLAAASAHRPLAQVFTWVTDPNDTEAVDLLRAAGYTQSASLLLDQASKPEKQRAGVYGVASRLVAFMTNRQAMSWVSPPPKAGVKQFSAEEFVRSTDTLYSLSREGRGNAGALTTALTVAICEAAEEFANTCPGGRLPVPMVVVLDEAANVCRWHELPDLYSHYGSRGIHVMTFLQSWSQGVGVWGIDGMRKLWSAATVKVYGGGVTEPEFLEEMSKLIGDYQHTEISTSRQQRGNASTSYQHRTDRILDVADLAAMDRGRIVVFASGTPPVMAKTLPWFQPANKAAKATKTAIEASISAHDRATYRPELT